MTFSSITFIFYFLPLVLLITGGCYFAMRPFLSQGKLTGLVNIILLFCSLTFYYWGEGGKIWVLLLSIASTFLNGLVISAGQKHNNSGVQKVGITIGVVTNLGLLAWFKYSNFGLLTINSLFNLFGANSNPIIIQVALPLGISFFTFQSISYLLDIYWKRINATKNVVAFSCYITFFPQLVAGPIVRFSEIQSEIFSRKINLASISEGSSRFIIGLSKKVLIANPVGLLADDLFKTQPSQLSTIGCWLAATAYAVQILFDFSGYSDMAIGLAKIFGIKIPENFKSPYKSKSLRSFWRNWHISLSSWFRDYLYIPLGGSRLGSRRTCIHLFIVFITCGLWHGASLNFIIWGGLHGLFLGIEHLFVKMRIAQNVRIPSVIKQLYMIVIVFSAWILFRTNDINQALHFYEFMFLKIEGFEKATLPISLYSLESQIALGIGLLFSIVSIKNPIPLNDYTKLLLQRSTLICLLALCMAYLAISSHNPFIYFRF